MFSDKHKLALVMAITVALAGCGTVKEIEVIRTVEVRVPVPVACNPQLGLDPAYPDTPEAILNAPNVFERAKLYAAGRLMRDARERELKAALAECRAGADPTQIGTLVGN